jgi:histidine triad (HIT) family protein
VERPGGAGRGGAAARADLLHWRPVSKTLFAKIIDGEIPGRFVFQDQHAVAIHDLHPQAPTHILVIPRRPWADLGQVQEGDEVMLGHLLRVAHRVAAEQGLQQGYRLVVNCGPHGQQTVPHLHIHVLGGRQMTWPPG